MGTNPRLRDRSRGRRADSHITMGAAGQGEGRKGADLLLEHCATLDRLVETRSPVDDRLEQELGSKLAQRLVHALAGDHRARPRVDR